MFKGYRILDYNFKLVIMVIAVSSIGILAVGSARESYQNRQLMGVIAGVVIMIITSLINYSLILRLYWLIYAANIGLLALVAIMGWVGGGAQRWLEIGSFRFQPSETAKILLILFYAQFIMKYKDKINSIPVLLACVAFMGAPLYLIYEQPDLSTTIVVFIMFCFIMYAGGISYKLIIGALAITIPAIAILISLSLQPDNDILTTYQKERVLAFINPEEYADTTAYQQLNSVTAIASGQLEGKGYKNNEVTSVKNGNFIAEPQTDFIFAVIGEEFGFQGSVVVIVLLMGISLECISIARKAKDVAGRIIATGVGGLIGVQSFINIGVATLVLPNTGLPLPFVSVGNTFLWSLFIGIGLVLNVRLQAKRITTIG